MIFINRAKSILTDLRTWPKVHNSDNDLDFLQSTIDAAESTVKEEMTAAQAQTDDDVEMKEGDQAAGVTPRLVDKTRLREPGSPETDRSLPPSPKKQSNTHLATPGHISDNGSHGQNGGAGWQRRIVTQTQAQSSDNDGHGQDGRQGRQVQQQLETPNPSSDAEGHGEGNGEGSGDNGDGGKQ